MPCLACGHEIAPDQSVCGTCYTPAGAPAVRPETATYSVRGVGIAASAAVILTVLLSTALSIWPIVGRAMAERAQKTQDPDLLNQAAIYEGIVALPAVGVNIVAIVLVIIWFYRARKNLDAFPGAGPTMGAGWAIGGWFVPFANFVIPCRVMANIARDSLWKPRTPALVGVWWGAWLVYTLADQVVARIDMRAYEELPTELAGEADFQAYVDYYADALGPNMLGLAAGIVAGAALVVLILRISSAQQARIARGGPSGPVMPGMTVAAPAVLHEDGGTIRA